MKLAPAICLLIFSSGLFEPLAQHTLPNGKRPRYATRKSSTPTPAETPASALAPPAAAAPAAPSRTDPAVKFEVTAQSGTDTKIEIKADPRLPERRPPAPCINVADAHDWLERTDRAATVLRELLDASDRGMPQGILNRSDCVAVVPSMKKGGLTIGGQWGRGVMSCRFDNKVWSPPVFFTMTGGSFGLQIGFQFTDLVMIIADRSGADALLHNNFEIGASAGGTAFIMGRQAGVSSDALLTSRVFTYARSRGLFAGLELKGAYIRPDETAHR